MSIYLIGVNEEKVATSAAKKKPLRGLVCKVHQMAIRNPVSRECVHTRTGSECHRHSRRKKSSEKGSRCPCFGARKPKKSSYFTKNFGVDLEHPSRTQVHAGAEKNDGTSRQRRTTRSRRSVQCAIAKPGDGRPRSGVRSADAIPFIAAAQTEGDGNRSLSPSRRREAGIAGACVTTRAKARVVTAIRPLFPLCACHRMPRGPSPLPLMETRDPL